MMGNERGVALVVAVLVMITATLLGIAAVMTSDIEIRIAGNQRCLEKAFYAADAGVNGGLDWLMALGPTAPDRALLPKMEEEHPPLDDSTSYNYSIIDTNYKAPPPPGWEMTMFEKRYYRVRSKGRYVDPSDNEKDLASKEVEVIASYIFPK